ncbi:DsbA family protein [Hoeflea sp. TYP-13]|uniref:DsbA family protein n=1 Tax=Hoeflea sp. TYP-13 TaxID=3230023 RepID=UPI0034C6DBCD
MQLSSNVVFRAFPKLAAGVALTVLVAACSDSGSDATKVSDAAGDASVNEVKIDPVTTAAVDLPDAEGDVDMAEVLKPGPMKEMFLGDPEAPVKIVEYMSMTCPHCANFHNGTFKQIITDYVDTGKVQFIVREFPFDPRATAAIMLARCAPEDKFFPMVDVLMQQQSNWARAQDAAAALFNISKLAGFTQESFNECLTNQKLVDDVNEVRKKAAEEFGVNSTPTFLINGKRYPGNMSVESMSALIDSLL